MSVKSEEIQARMDAAVDDVAKAMTSVRASLSAETVPRVMARIAGARRAGDVWRAPRRLAWAAAAASLLLAVLIGWQRPWDAAPPRLGSRTMPMPTHVRPPQAGSAVGSDVAIPDVVRSTSLTPVPARDRAPRVRVRRAAVAPADVMAPAFALLATDPLLAPPAAEEPLIAAEPIAIQALTIDLLTMEALPAPPQLDVER